MVFTCMYNHKILCKYTFSTYSDSQCLCPGSSSVSKGTKPLDIEVLHDGRKSYAKYQLLTQTQSIFFGTKVKLLQLSLMGIYAYTRAQWSTNRGCFLGITVIFFEGGGDGSGSSSLSNTQ